MDSPPTGAAALTIGSTYASNNDEASLMLPKSELDALSELEVDQLQTDLVTELFGFSRTSFIWRMTDVANEVIYDVIDKVEVECKRRWIGDETDGPVDPARKQAVEKGVNRVETLLMAAVDLRFDQAEVWLFRNTFTIPRNLIPYVLFLHHPQEGFGPYMQKGADEELMKELEVTIAKVNSQREEIAILDLVHERQFRRVQALKEVKSKLSQLLAGGGARDTLSTATKSLAIELPSFMAECRRLLSSSASSTLASSTATDASSDGQAQPWGQSREAYLAWRIEHSKQDEPSGQDKDRDDDMRAMSTALSAQGNAQDSAALKNLLEG